ncbi:hypothetical protein Nepgr_008412 [Nepenthes gracilis]|uniref:F-box domain-containing protein n=1 Tax=Nepenthes gracilis TaxID=150966 RepID=A0AAD3S9G5_NEPGR|nr:hypothetical protein Nepgr_008412 [Nepenthes gracilis]
MSYIDERKIWRATGGNSNTSQTLTSHTYSSLFLLPSYRSSPRRFGDYRSSVPRFELFLSILLINSALGAFGREDFVFIQPQRLSNIKNMGKVSPKDKESKTPRKRRRFQSSSNKYLKPGALARLRYSKVSAAKSCTDLGKKRVVLSDAKKMNKNGFVIENKVIDDTPPILSPEKFCFSPVAAPLNTVKQGNLLRTPKTPVAEDSESESRLEALPMDLLVRVLCHLHHDQLRAVFHVSQRIRRAVLLARQFHFNYTTPDRSRQEMLRTMTPLVTEHWPFVSKEESKGLQMPRPHTPKAPRHGPRPPSRLKCTEMRQVAAVLFQESSFPSRCMVPSVLSKPLCKNRVLFYEDELCKAVAQNNLR